MQPDNAVAYHAVELRPEPASVREARRLVTGALLDAARSEDVADTAALLVSELVTNAVLHARTTIGVSVTVTPGSVLIEVSDHSPHLPARRSFDEEATTGRGLELLELLATDHGVRRVDDHGKVVWFSLGAASQEESPGRDAEPGVPSSGVEVALLGTPPRLLATWQQHAAALLREHMLMCLDPGRPMPPAALQEAAAANEALAALTEATAAHLDDASAAPPTVDLRVTLPPDAAPGFAVLHEVLAICVQEAEAGELLAPASQPEIVALRQWCCSEVLRQAAGLPPTRWQSVPHPTTQPSARPAPRWDASWVSGSELALVAADDTNRILAVSAPGARLLGWEPADLVGRRVVTVIPPRLHEAHIVGFLRYLLTGERRLVGTSVSVAAQHRDGTEIPVTLTLSAHAVTGGRTVFIAELALQ